MLIQCDQERCQKSLCQWHLQGIRPTNHSEFVFSFFNKIHGWKNLKNIRCFKERKHNISTHTEN